jgi:hypothetical protein
MILTKEQRDRIDEFAASFFEKSDDVRWASDSIWSVLEHRMELIAKRDAQEGKSA